MDAAEDARTNLEWVDLVRLQDGDGLAEALHRFCARARVLLGALSVSVTVVVGGELVTGGASDELSFDMDQQQYQLHEGPCLVAASEQIEVRAPELSAETRWPTFVRRAIDNGVCAMVCAPLDSTGSYLGAINVYGGSAGAFDDEALKPHFDALREHASVLLHNAGLHAQASAQADQLRVAMESRGVIEQAKGILVARERVDPDTAWEYLVRMSQRSHRKLRDIAQDVVNRATTGTLG